MTEDLVSFYHGNEPGQTPGLLPGPYYCMFRLNPLTKPKDMCM